MSVERYIRKAQEERSREIQEELGRLVERLGKQNALYKMAMEMAADDTLFFRDGGKGLTVICNDTFAPATADGEEIEWSEVEELYAVWRKGWRAVERWLVERVEERDGPDAVKWAKEQISRREQRMEWVEKRCKQ